jgi:hypothetical protein
MDCLFIKFLIRFIVYNYLLLFIISITINSMDYLFIRFSGKWQQKLKQLTEYLEYSMT